MRMNKRNYILLLLGCVAFVLGGFNYFHALEWLQLPTTLLWWCNGIVAVLFILGALIITAGQTPIHEKFAQRFLIMTTFHFFAIFAILITVWYTSKEHLRSFSLQFITLFILLLIVQSLLLMVLIRNKQ